MTMQWVEPEPGVWVSGDYRIEYNFATLRASYEVRWRGQKIGLSASDPPATLESVQAACQQHADEQSASGEVKG